VPAGPAQPRRSPDQLLIVQTDPNFDLESTLRSDICAEIAGALGPEGAGPGRMAEWRRFLAPCFRHYVTQMLEATRRKAAVMRSAQFSGDLRAWVRAMPTDHRRALLDYYRAQHGALKIKVRAAAQSCASHPRRRFDMRCAFGLKVLCARTVWLVLQNVKPHDPRQHAFSRAEEEAAERHDYSDEEIEGNDSESDEEPQAAVRGRARRDRIRVYNLDALSARQVDVLWERAASITLQHPLQSWTRASRAASTAVG
jgi:hypothetical protein